MEMEEKNNKKGKLLYIILGIVLLLAIAGGTYAFFSASVSNSGTIGGNTQNINNNSLTLTVKKVVFTGASAPSNDLVPAFFGRDSNEDLNVSDPSELGQTQVASMLTNKCEKNGFTGCHVYQIKIQANQDITHANLLLNLSVGNLSGAANVVDKSQWGYVVFSATGTVDASTGATAGLTNPVLNTNNGAPAAIGNGVTNLDIHNDSSLTANTAVTYYLLVYLNDTGEVQNNISSNTGDGNYAIGTYSGSLELQALGGEVRADFGPQGQNAAQYITNLYTNATKSTATVNSITYNLASSENLMNDRHASTSVNIDAGDIRYYGSSPKNYIYFNCSDYSNQSSSTCEKWRIIGVFDGKLKIIRNESIGNYSWDTSYGSGGNEPGGPTPKKASTNDSNNVSAMQLNNILQKEKNTKAENLEVSLLLDNAVDVNGGSGVNEWSQADIMKLLNPGYSTNQDFNSSGNTITVNNSLYWDSGSGNCYNANKDAYKTCNFTTTGLKNDTTKNMIYNATWYLGASTGSSSYVNAMYNAERQNVTLGKACSSGNNCNDNVQRTSSWSGKVGLIYPSDYGYATDLSLCSSTLSNYNNTSCYSNNWLFNFEHQWTITSYANSYDATSVFYIRTANSSSDRGKITSWNCYDAFTIRPVVYLNSSVLIDTVGKDGSEAHPYEISLS